jgi:hypothetical protein
VVGGGRVGGLGGRVERGHRRGVAGGGHLGRASAGLRPPRQRADRAWSRGGRAGAAGRARGAPMVAEVGGGGGIWDF